MKVSTVLPYSFFSPEMSCPPHDANAIAASFPLGNISP